MLPFRNTMNAYTENMPILARAEELPQDAGYLEVVTLMAQELSDSVPGTDAAQVVRCALEREACEATYVGRGMAVPHARVPGLDKAMVYIARSRGGITWQRGTATLVVLLAVPEECAELHLQLLGQLMRWRLMQVTDEQSILAMPAAELQASVAATLAAL